MFFCDNDNFGFVTMKAEKARSFLKSAQKTKAINVVKVVNTTKTTTNIAKVAKATKAIVKDVSMTNNGSKITSFLKKKHFSKKTDRDIANACKMPDI